VAQSLAIVAEAWRACGPNAMNAVVAQNLGSILDRIAHTAAAVQSNNVTVLDAGDGETMARLSRVHAQTVSGLRSKTQAAGDGIFVHDGSSFVGRFVTG
jgi:hypothetical protein